MDPFDVIRDTFFEECVELLESLETGLQALQSGQQEPDTIDAIFRAVHSIKGGAAAFDLQTLVTFAHIFESSLDALRSGRLSPDGNTVAVLLRASDQLADLVMCYRNGEDLVEPSASELTELFTAISAINEDSLHPSEPDNASGSRGSKGKGLPTTDRNQNTDVPLKIWNIFFEPLPDLLLSGNEPLFLFRALEVFGHLVVTALDDDLPTLSEMNPKTPRLRWKIVLGPSAAALTETEIESVFDFVTDLSLLEISPDISKEIDGQAEEKERDDFDSLQTVTNSDLSGDNASLRSYRKPGEAAVNPQKSNLSSPGASLISEQAMSSSQGQTATIRVDLGRVDRLVNLIGELVINHSMMAQGLSEAEVDRSSGLISNLDDLQKLTRDMQESVMSIRAQPVRSLFQRMTRIVREAAQITGKTVALVTEGDGTEIDKTVVERLADPLTHIIRNAIDHGLEISTERIAAGKPASGTIRLSARQQSDRVTIVVSDDGRGIDRERVWNRAVQQGLIPNCRKIDTSEIDRLIFLPGFSTVDTASPLSGRGVGMDIVQRAVQNLNGSISVESFEGAGCTISVSLPLTLAILDGMIVRSNLQRMVIPLSSIIKTQTLDTARIERLDPGGEVVRLHDKIVPLVDLADAMGFDGPMDRTFEEDAAILFVQIEDSHPFAIRVDAIESQGQIVIKGLGESFGHMPCVSAATILGNGQVALIVDPAGLALSSGLPRYSQNVQNEVAIL